MTLELHRSDYLNSDFDLQYQWYLRKGGVEVAERYFDAVISTLNDLARQPGLGLRRRFIDPALKDLRSFRVGRPFDVHLIFYRYTERQLFAERMIHGARDLPRRLLEPPGSAGD